MPFCPLEIMLSESFGCEDCATAEETLKVTGAVQERMPCEILDEARPDTSKEYQLAKVGSRMTVSRP